MDERFSRCIGIIGKDGLCKLNDSTVAVFGIGGVGSAALEALVRSGIGTVYIYDNDTVTVSNINRQLVAYESTVGQSKVSVTKRRCMDINPNVKVFDFCEFIGKDSALPFDKFDFIIDAVDNVTAKIFLIENAQKNDVPIISVMGTGKKLDIAKLKISRIEDTKECPLCRVMRKELKERNIHNVPVVWSDETPVKSDINTVSSMMFVPSCAGLLAAQYVVKNLIG